MDVIKKAYLQEEERENSEVSPREVGHNIYILALQVLFPWSGPRGLSLPLRPRPRQHGPARHSPRSLFCFTALYCPRSQAWLRPWWRGPAPNAAPRPQRRAPAPQTCH